MDLETAIVDHPSEKIRISDLGGQEEYSFLWPELLKKAHTLVLVYEKGIESNLYDVKDLLYKTVTENNITLNSVKYVIPVSTKMDLVDEASYGEIAELYEALSSNEKREMGLEEALIFPTVPNSVVRSDMKYNFYYTLRQAILYDYILFKVSNNISLDKSSILYFPVVLFGRGSTGKSTLRDTLIEKPRERYTKTIGIDNGLAISVGRFKDLHDVELIEEREVFEIDDDVYFLIPMFTNKR